MTPIPVFVLKTAARALPFVMLFCAILGTAGYAYSAQAAVDGAERRSETDISLENPAETDNTRAVVQLIAGLNYRMDKLDWNIAGQKDGTNPNILSELTWDDIKIYELSLGITSRFGHGFYFKGGLNFGVIVDGENQDSDYESDNRRDEFSRSNNSADDGRTIDISAGIGYEFSAASDRLILAPLIGLSYHTQNLTMTDGYQTVTSEGGPPLGPFEGLDSSYSAQWFGPWIGLELRSDIKTRKGLIITPTIAMEYHRASYYAQADWNLRSDFEHPKSFEHEAWGNGLLARLGIGFGFNKNWSMMIGYTHQKWQTEDGVDRVYVSGGGTVETRLNEVNWESKSVNLIFEYQF